MRRYLWFFAPLILLVIPNSAVAQFSVCETWISITQAPGSQTTDSTAFIVVEWEEIETDPACVSAGLGAMGFSINGEDRTSYFTQSTGYASGTVPLFPGVNQLVASTSGYDSQGNPMLYADSVTTIYLAPPIRPGVVLNHHNGTNFDRSRCLTLGAGEGGAIQCGDLLMAHALPAYRTRGRDRSLTLLYNSATAVPLPLVAVRVTQSPVHVPPSTVKAELWTYTGSGMVKRAEALYSGWGGSGSGDPEVRQIGLAFDAAAAGLTSRIDSFQLRIINQYGQGSPLDSMVAGPLLIVNRAVTNIAAGWEVAGIERLALGQPGSRILWIGADGSAIAYLSAGVNKWAASPAEFRDTIVVEGTGYARRLKKGGKVVFDAQGRHIRTITRTGDTTAMYWSTTLDSLRVPPRGQAATWYRFWYDTLGLDSIADPVGRKLRVTVVPRMEAPYKRTLTQVADPDGVATGFGYDAQARTTSRTNRRGFTTSYVYGSGLRVTAVKVPLLGSDTATTTIEHWDQKGTAVGFPGNGPAPGDPATLYTKVFGPRVGVADDATFLIDKWGSPTLITTALGHQTTVTRGDTARPALTTRVQFPNGRKVRMGYDGVANLLWQMDSTHSAGVAIDSFRYHTQWQEVVAIVPPLRDSTTFSYDAGNGNLLSTRDPQGNQTDFRYYAGTDLLRAVCAPGCGTKPDSFEYNALGNLTKTFSPLHTGAFPVLWTRTHDSYGNVRSVTDPLGLLVETFHTALNLDTLERRINGSDSARVRKWRNVGGLVDSIEDPIGLRHRWLYDAAGRVIRKRDQAGERDSLVYDAAGNVIKEYTRAYVIPVSPPILRTFDALGRLTQVVLPAQEVTRALLGSTMTLPPDTIRYTYDSMGNITLATDRDSKVQRTYTPEGSVATETQTIASGTFWQPNLTTTENVYAWSFVYDKNGRLTTVNHPTTAASSPPGLGNNLPGYNGKTQYVFGTNAPVAGRLATIIGPVGDSLAVHFDTRGRLDSLILPGNVRESRRYDLANSLSWVGAARGATWVRRDSLIRDKVGSLVYGSRWREHEHPSATPDTASFDFDGLHRLKTGRYRAPGVYEREVANFRYDRAGNRTQDSTYDPSGAYPPVTQRHTYGGGRLTLVEQRVGSDPWYAARQQFWNLDGSLNIRSVLVEQPGIGYGWLNFQYFYDRKGELIRTEHAYASDSDRVFVEFTFSDAFGRRVLSKAEDSVGVAGGYNLTPTHRMLHVGNDRVILLQSSTTSKGGINNKDGTGRIYVHGPAGGEVASYGTMGDGPSCGDTVLYHHRDERGTVVQKTKQNGQVPPCFQNNRRLLPIDFSPFGVPASLGSAAIPDGYTGAPHDNGRFGLVYLRNRYYDPETGRFTQEDPIGFAGGINLYAYAGNDPGTYTDPFGLCKPWPECWAQVAANIGAARGDWVGSTMLNVAAGVNAVMEATGINQIGAALGAGDIRGGVKHAMLTFVGPTGGRGVNRVFSARALGRMADEAGPFHNFPAWVDNLVLQGERQVVSDDYVVYTRRGGVNGVEGTFEIGVRPSDSGRNETIVHRFFRPERE